MILKDTTEIPKLPTTEYFLALTCCPRLREGESRSKGGSTTPELLIVIITVFQVPLMATAVLNTGVGGRGHLRRISETGKVIKLSLE